MKLSKKFFSAVLAVVLATTTLFGTTVSFAEQTMADDTVVLISSNLRGDIDTLAKIAAVKADYESKGADVILTDTGNFLQGTLYASADRGYTVITMMEQVGYDVVALGTYDFAFGDGQMGAKPHGTLVQYHTLSALLNGGTANSVDKPASSIKALSTNANGSNSYFTFKKNMTTSTVISSDVSVGFVGITNPNAPSMVLENSLAGITFDDDADMYNDARIIAKSLRSSADVVVCLSNLDSVDETKTGADLTINSAQTESKSLCAVVVNSDAKIVSVDSVNLDAVTADSAIKSVVDSKKAEIDAKYPSVAKSLVTLNGSQIDVRSKETNLGDLWCDALKWFALNGGIENYYSEDYKAISHKDVITKENVVAIWNGGNLRDYIYTGDVIAQDIDRTLPYPNTVAVVYVTGAQLLEALEASMQYDAAFPSVAGIEYNIDASAKLDLATDKYNNSKYYVPNSINQISISKINGKAFDKDATYAVITSNMIFNGGDTYGAFAKKSIDSVNTSMKVTKAVWSYIQNELGGVIGENYAKPDNRITLNHIHKLVSMNAESATCGKSGKQADKVCSICNEIVTKGAVIKATGKHTYDAGVVTKAPTSSATGVMTYTCKICKAKKTASIAKLAKVSGLKLTAQKKGFKVSWKKASSATGYEIQYATDSKFKKNKKTVTVSKNSTVSKSITKLSAKKKYYVRVRTYKTINSKKYYGSWASTKNITTKK